MVVNDAHDLRLLDRRVELRRLLKIHEAHARLLALLLQQRLHWTDRVERDAPVLERELRLRVDLGGSGLGGISMCGAKCGGECAVWCGSSVR